MTQEERFMQRAFELAALGLGSVSPNPLVGCVIVRDNKIVGEGWHRKWGEAHAEVNAVKDAEESVAGATVYVTLEPCSHFGKTPPCADLLIKEKVSRVVIANEDPNPLVAGSGISKLRAAGIAVETGVLANFGLHFNRRFFTFIQQQRPFVILKWAQTADGFVARANYESRWISNEQSRQLVHRWRAEEDAVLVGTRTAAHDNPALTVRNWSGRNPVRVVIDRFLRLPEHLHLFDGTVKTICYNVLRHEERQLLTLVRLDEANFLPQLLHDLHQRGIQSIIIEGGADTLRHMITANLWDEARIFTSLRTFGEGIAAPALTGKVLESLAVGDDQLKIIARTGTPA